MSCSDLRPNKGADWRETYTFPADYDFTGWTALGEIKAAQGDADPALLAISDTATANGSVSDCAGRTVSFFFARDDLQALPDADPVSDPWVGIWQAVLTDPNGVIHQLDMTSFIVDKGVIQ